MRRDLVVMGVAGCGKSSLAAAFAQAQALPMVEGDAFHSPSSVDKMSRGVALTDADRQDWLERLATELKAHHGGVVLSCSALRHAYRERLRAASPGLRFAFLSIDRESALARVRARATTHFFSASLVDSQFATLEEPIGEPGVLRLDARLPLADLRDQLSAWWRSLETT
jgi:gluconokinase